VNYLWGTSGVGYNAAKIKERMPDAPVDSFAMFYDPKVVSKFQDCGVTLLDAPSEVAGTVLLYLGKDANSEKPEDLAAVEKVLMAIRPYVKYVNSSKPIEDLANGEVCLSLAWSGDVLQARDRANEAGKGIEIKYLIPREGRSCSSTCWPSRPMPSVRRMRTSSSTTWLARRSRRRTATSSITRTAMRRRCQWCPRRSATTAASIPPQSEGQAGPSASRDRTRRAVVKPSTT
jgi:hypothetical protein